MPGWAQRFPALGRLQATTLALRLGRNLGLGGGSEQQAWVPPAAAADVAARRRDDLPAAIRARWDAVVEVLGADAAERALLGRAMADRALAGGSGIEAIEFLARSWGDLTDAERSQVAAPLRPGGGSGPGPLFLAGAPARQTDQTTCGPTVLAMLAAAGDPLLALWLVTGQSLAGQLPREVRAVDPAQRSAADAATRFGALQRAIKTRSNAGGLGPLPWPAALGTPPWGAPRVARYPGATFSDVMIDDTDAAGFGALLDRADRALAAGVPVPLFTGGDLASGVATAVPRHVVLLTGSSAAPGSDRYAIFEPASGAVHVLSRTELLAPAGARSALGGWSHVCWAVLPGA